MKPLLLTFLPGLFLVQFGNAQVGKVGINTSSPAAMLHVKDSSVVFTGTATLPIIPGTPPVSGIGSRMMWYPAKSAFRAGTVEGTQWDKNNIGNYSFATGFSCKASGQYANSIGNNCSATESSSLAGGSFNVASNFASVAFGHLCHSTGAYSFTMGQESIASGVHSCAIGSRSTAKGNASFSCGEDVMAKSFSCTVFGRFNDTTSTSSQTWNVNDPVFIVGNGTNNANRSNALTILKNGNVGINTTAPSAMLHVKDSSVLFTGLYPIPASGNPPASGAGTRWMWYPAKSAFRAGTVDGTQWDKNSIGNYSFASGFNCKASGQHSISLGNNCFATGNKSLAAGASNNASGEGSVALGGNCYSTDSYSFSMGLDNISTGHSSFAVGFRTKAHGHHTFSCGFETLAKPYACAVYGRYNDTTSINSDVWELNDPVFIIGNGSSNANRSNAMTVLKNGNMGIGVISPGFPLNFANALGDKISLFGNGGVHYGFGVQNNLLQIHADVMGSDIAFGYGSSAGLTETMRIKGNGNIGIANNNPGFKLDISGRMRLRHSSDGSPGTWYNKSDNSAAISFIGLFNDNHVGIYSELGASWNFLMNLTNGNIGIGITPTQKLHVSGNGLFTGTVTASCGVLVCSDMRYKTNIQTLTNSLSHVLALRGISYDWDTEHFPEKQFKDQRQIGFAAQELEKIIPEMVHTDETGYKTVDYTRLSPVLVEAMKEQQLIINNQQKQIDLLNSRLDKLTDILIAMDISLEEPLVKSSE